jgi:uncharacterized metal-binding protein/predicted Fe-Mo cluster-binding NifX family protein
MCYAIPILADRVSPRCTIADGILFLVLNGNKVVTRIVEPFHGTTWIDLMRVLVSHKTDLLVCGGIGRDTRATIEGRGMRIIHNVSCTVSEAIEALENGKLRPGFGFANPGSESRCPRLQKLGSVRANTGDNNTADSLHRDSDYSKIDCIACDNRVCLQGKSCVHHAQSMDMHQSDKTRRILESARDIATESERILCRVSELVYFCLEMDYRSLGIAFCVDLFEATNILTSVLRRFFEVHPICCKIGGETADDPWALQEAAGNETSHSDVRCNPQLQAHMLNELGTDLNVIVGLCMGADCVFTHASEAPVTTLFVKDRSLANNPIGALYSDYYLKEVNRSARMVESNQY